jgi:hypothetical protein
MSGDLENFRSWFVRVLETLYPQREAGLALLMIVFPLLERFLRLKVGLSPDADLGQPFFEELSKRFPTLQTEKSAREFWQVFRNGLLHQVVFANQTRPRGKNPSRPLPAGVLSHDFLEVISAPPGGEFLLNTRDFAKEVIKQIEAEFEIFEGRGSSAPRLAIELVEVIDEAAIESSKITRTHPQLAPLVRTSTRSPPRA